MSRSNNATARQIELGHRPVATSSAKQVERFVAKGAVYRWEERSARASAEGTSPSREALGQMFTRTLVPQAERRGARGLVFEAAARPGTAAGEVRWVAWRVAGDAAPIWGLYVASHLLDGTREGSAANDAYVLIAWGDGAALAWADDREVSRAALRAALREPPPWAERGIRSRDVTFPVRVEVLRRVGSSGGDTQMCLALAPVATSRSGENQTASREVLLDMVRSWRASHPLMEKAANG